MTSCYCLRLYMAEIADMTLPAAGRAVLGHSLTSSATLLNFISFCPCCCQHVFFSPSLVSVTSQCYRLKFSSSLSYVSPLLILQSHLISSACLRAPPAYVTSTSRPTWWQPITSSARPDCLRACSTAVMKTKQTLLIGVPDSRKLD